MDRQGACVAAGRQHDCPRRAGDPVRRAELFGARGGACGAVSHRGAVGAGGLGGGGAAGAGVQSACGAARVWAGLPRHRRRGDVSDGVRRRQGLWPDAAGRRLWADDRVCRAGLRAGAVAGCAGAGFCLVSGRLCGADFDRRACADAAGAVYLPDDFEFGAVGDRVAQILARAEFAGVFRDLWHGGGLGDYGLWRAELPDMSGVFGAVGGDLSGGGGVLCA